MFEPNNSIIIVDDVQAHIDSLTRFFLGSGIGCRTILYDQLYDSPLSGVRLAFFDINITNKTIDLTQTNFNYKSDRNLSSAFNDLATALRNCIDSNNGPYALVFWSSNTKLINNFISYVRDAEKGFTDLPSPIFIDSIDKDIFLSEGVEKLSQRVNSIFANKSIKLLFDFQTKCNQGVSELINSFYKIIPKNQKSVDNVWGSYVDFETNFDKIFSKIAHQTLGFEYSKDKPDKAIVDSLLPIQNHILSSYADTSNIWANGLTKIGSKNLKYPNGFNVGKLNAIFHIENTTIIDKEVRGAVVQIVCNSYNLKSLRVNNLDEWIKKIIPFLKEQQDNQAQAGFLKECSLIAVEISAACDFTNKKKRLNKYILGVITPNVDVKKCVDLSTTPDNSYHVGGTYFNVEDSDFQIWLNFNYVFASKPQDKRFGNLRFVLKKEIMDMIGNKYANHVSRIGITSF